MSGMHPRGVTKCVQHTRDRVEQRGVVAAGQVGAADRSGKQCVADVKIPGGGAFLTGADLQAHAAGAMTGRVIRPRFTLAEGDHFAGAVQRIDRWHRFVEIETEHPRLVNRAVVEEEVVRVQMDRHAERAFRGRHTGHVIDVGVREEDAGERDAGVTGEREQPLDLVARIDDHALFRALAGDDEAVLEEGADRLGLDYDHPVILAIVDDLMFSSKIRASSKALDVPVNFARTRENALTAMRAETPTLVIFDLDAQRTDPLGIISDMKADAALSGIPTLAFVSHVHADLIQAARQAGIDNVMARSGFTMQLPDILSAAR